MIYQHAHGARRSHLLASKTFCQLGPEPNDISLYFGHAKRIKLRHLKHAGQQDCRDAVKIDSNLEILVTNACLKLGFKAA